MYISGGNQLIDPKNIIKKADLEEGFRVADFGCGGAGHFVVPSARAVGPKGRVFAVDILRSVLTEINKKARMEGLGNIKGVWANLEILGSTKIPEKSLDVVYLINILFQSKERENIFHEAKRVLKPGGKLLVVDWTSRAVPFGPPRIDRVKPKGIRLLADSMSFALIDEFEAGKYHFGLLFNRT